jgi:transposase-like protein
MTPVVRPDAASRTRQEAYLARLASGASVSDAARAAGVRIDSVPHWRVRYPEFARRESEIQERAEVRRELSLTRQCVCGRTFKAKRPGQEFCSKRCATREVKTAYWGPKDSLVLDTLRERPSTRRALVAGTGIPIASLRSILNRLHRRRYIERIGATRGLYAVWTAT